MLMVEICGCLKYIGRIFEPMQQHTPAMVMRESFIGSNDDIAVRNVKNAWKKKKAGSYYTQAKNVTVSLQR